MSAPFTELLLHLGTRWGVPASVFIMAFLGSGHCAAMCGGIAVMASAGSNLRAQVTYQMARLAGYLSLGALSGLVGKTFLADAANSGLPTWVGLAIATTFLITGWRLWGRSANPHELHASSRIGRILVNLSSKAWKFLVPRTDGRPLLRAALIGLLTFLLPCGLLYSYVLLAIASADMTSGCLVLLAFWLGTAPALSFAPWLFRIVGLRLPRKQMRWIAVLLMGLGLFNLVEKVAPTFRRGASAKSDSGEIPICSHGSPGSRDPIGSQQGHPP